MTNRSTKPSPRGKTQTGSGARGAQAALARATAAAEEGAAALGLDPELQSPESEAADNTVRQIARRVSQSQNRLTGGNTLEVLARLRQDSLLSTPLADPGASKTGVTDGGATLKNALDAVEASSLNELFLSERGRTDDYLTFQQVYDLITQASEAIQTYTDSIVSPDDFTKRDVNVFYDGRDAPEAIQTEFQDRTRALVDKYNLEDRLEEAISKSLTKGDFFMAVLNLRQELELLLTEDGRADAPGAITEQHVPSTEDPDMRTLAEWAATEAATVDTATLRSEVAAYLDGLVVVHEDASNLAMSQNSMNLALGTDMAKRASRRGKLAGSDREKRVSLADANVRGSIIKMIPPENVIKLYQGETLFGYFFIELSGPDLADMARRGTMDQTTIVRAIDQSLSARALGTSANSTQPDRGKDAVIGRVIVRTLAAKLGKASFIKDNEEIAADAYSILSRARRENRRATFTFVAPDQMVHFTPNGASGYGDSVLSRVKFLAKLYIGAMTNAFMRNSIRQPEKLVWYLDVGADNDGSNAIQNFIRTIKQREVKFSDLKNITTTINQIGQFHDFYVPTYNGEKPVEVETLNMGAAAEVDNAYLEFLRKAIIGGMGVPAAFVGYSEEVAFARSLTMDNGRFLRRVIRHQKHFGRAASRLFRMIWRNEYSTLEELVGEKRAGESAERKADGRTEDPLHELDVSKISVVYPSPATLNMTNLADAINQGEPVADFIVNNVASGKNDDVKGELKRMVLKDLMPQIHWNKYEDMLDVAEEKAARVKTISGGGEGGGGAASDAAPEGGTDF